MDLYVFLRLNPPCLLTIPMADNRSLSAVAMTPPAWLALPLLQPPPGQRWSFRCDFFVPDFLIHSIVLLFLLPEMPRLQPLLRHLRPSLQPVPPVMARAPPLAPFQRAPLILSLFLVPWFSSPSRLHSKRIKIPMLYTCQHKMMCPTSRNAAILAIMHTLSSIFGAGLCSPSFLFCHSLVFMHDL